MADRSRHDLQRQLDDLRAEFHRLERKNVALAAAARADPLTNLMNRRGWEETATREHERYRRTGRTYSMLVIDVDQFKSYNDHAGHLAGDACLMPIADTLVKSSRAVDVVARIGGEEFVILSPETTAKRADVLAHRVCRRIRELNITHPKNGPSEKVTVSVGLASAAQAAGESSEPEETESDGWKNVFELADRALYQAKAAGGDQVNMA